MLSYGNRLASELGSGVPSVVGTVEGGEEVAMFSIWAATRLLYRRLSVTASEVCVSHRPTSVYGGNSESLEQIGETVKLSLELPSKIQG